MNRRDFTKYLGAAVAGIVVSTKIASAHEHGKGEGAKAEGDCCKDGAAKGEKMDCCKDGAAKDGAKGEKMDCCKDGAAKDGAKGEKMDCCKDGAAKDGAKGEKMDCCKDEAAGSKPQNGEIK